MICSRAGRTMLRMPITRRWLPLAVSLTALLLASCATSSTAATFSTPTVARRATATGPLTPTATPIPRYVAVTLAHGAGHPDDLTLDAQNRVVFADSGSGDVFRIAANGGVTRLASGLPAPEGVLVEPDGALLVAIQGTAGEGTDSIVRLTPGSASYTVFATFTNRTGNVGLDGLSRDPRTGDVLAADSPNGVVSRISADGKQRSVLASGFTRPVDAIADGAGNVYVADEYGNAVAVVAPDGSVRTLAHLSLPDDLTFDTDGTLLVTLLGNNTLVRLDPHTGRLLATLATNLHEPQGLAVDATGNLYVSEETANTVIELQRR